MIEATLTPFQPFGVDTLIGLAALLPMVSLGRAMAVRGILAWLMQPTHLSHGSGRAPMSDGMINGQSAPGSFR